MAIIKPRWIDGNPDWSNAEASSWAMMIAGFGQAVCAPPSPSGPGLAPFDQPQEHWTGFGGGKGWWRDAAVPECNHGRRPLFACVGNCAGVVRSGGGCGLFSNR